MRFCWQQHVVYCVPKTPIPSPRFVLSTTLSPSLRSCSRLLFPRGTPVTCKEKSLPCRRIAAKTPHRQIPDPTPAPVQNPALPRDRQQEVLGGSDRRVPAKGRGRRAPCRGRSGASWIWSTPLHTGASEGELRSGYALTPSPSHSKNISLFTERRTSERVVSEDGYSSFLLIPCVGISNCRRGNSICR